MKVVADLHLHSRFSRAVSSQMTCEVMAEWAKKKGIDLVGSGDWTHPIWIRELKTKLEEAGEGVYKLRNIEDSSSFILSTELSSIYSQGGKTRRIHMVVMVPSFETADAINKELAGRGVNLISDGRPIMGLSAKEVAEIILGVDERSVIIPAHVWTPWFSLYGSNSGFDSIDECFGEMASNVFAIETGLSSDPAMNWRIEELAGRHIISSSDAHSPSKLGREATVFEMPEINYENVRKAIIGVDKSEGQSRIVYTIEFYPEEGKYHFTGHRKCEVVYSPKEARKKGTICPVCGKGLTVGVMSRVEALASEGIEVTPKLDRFGVRWIKEKDGKRPSYVMLVPLLEIISEATNTGVGSKAVLAVYDQLVANFGSEFDVLLKIPLDELMRVVNAKVVEGIGKVRSGDIFIEPGYDGVFGTVSIWRKDKISSGVKLDQASLF